MDTLLQDLRYALRSLRKSPGFAAVAVLTLALGIGANSAIFSVVNAVLLRPLGYADPEELVFIHTQFPDIGFDQFWISPPEYRELQEHTRSFEDIGAWRTGSVTLGGVENPRRIDAAVAGAELFSTLGVSARLGRTYTREEDVEGAAPVAVISHGLWRSAFGGDPGIIGRQVELNGDASRVIGVMPEGFDIQDEGIDVWVPLALPAAPTDRGSHFLNLVGRLAPGVTLDQARRDVAALVGRWEELAGGEHAPQPETHAMVVKPLREEVVGDVRPALLVLLGAVAFVLLIACANVANLLLARAEARQKEIAVRAALGAGRARLLGQFLTESVLLALIGGGVGLLIGAWGVDALVAMSPDSIPRAGSIGLDVPVLLFTLGVSVLTGLLFGLAPLLHLSQRVTRMALREGGHRSTAAAGRRRLRRILVASEVALAVVLVIGAGLLIRSFAARQAVDPGFEPGGLLTFETYLPESAYPEAGDRAAFFDRLLGRLEALPGITSAAAVAGLPPVRDVNANTTEFEGQLVAPDNPSEAESFTEIDYYQSVTGGYFETMHIPIVQGRAFDNRDVSGATPAVIINETAARVFYPNENPIGRRIRPSWVEPWFTIVGIAADVKQGGLDEPTGSELYFHYPQVSDGFSWAPRTMNLIVRSSRAPLTLAGEVRGAVRDIDPTLPLADLQTMEANLAGSLGRPRFLTLLLAVFAAVALLLAAVGTYGILSHSVAERRKEIGIRMALGAKARTVMGAVLRDGLAVAGIGLALGVLGALALTRLLSSLLFGVGTLDTATFVAAPVVLALVAAAACWLPARRATRVDPLTALRAE